MRSSTHKGIVCLSCQNTIAFNIPPFCRQCSRHLGAEPYSNQCHSCRRYQPHFDFAWGTCLYDDTLKKLIHEFKYNQRTLLCQLFHEKIAGFIEHYHFDINQFDYLVPIPLSAARFRERGYNQALLLAQELSRSFQIPLSQNNLIRVRHTPTQTLLDEKQRWTNLKGAFKMKNSCAFKDKSILIIDDLLTTGATASEAARVLKECAAKTVGVLTVGITL